MDPVTKLIAADAAKKRTVIVVGDSMLDVYVNGSVQYMACQEGCPKFVEHDRVYAPGGAANAARQMDEWNADADLVSILPLAGTVYFVGNKYGTDLSLCFGNIPIKTRYLAGNICVWRHDSEFHCYDLDESFLLTFRRKLLVSLRELTVDAVLIADYDKGLMDDDFIIAVIDVCTSRRIPVVVDAKRQPSVYAGAVIQCNEAYMHKHQSSTWPDVSAGLVVTHGRMPPTVGTKMLPWRPDVPCINHVGAGDCFAAHLTLSLAHGLSLMEAAIVADCAARVYVQHGYGQPPHPHEIKEYAERTNEA